MFLHNGKGQKRGDRVYKRLKSFEVSKPQLHHSLRSANVIRRGIITFCLSFLENTYLKQVEVPV